MTDPTLYLTVAGTGLAGIGILTAATLRGWHGWLELRKLELAQAKHDGAAPNVGSRIELADLKERIRKLEAIAAGVDL